MYGMTSRRWMALLALLATASVAELAQARGLPEYHAAPTPPARPAAQAKPTWGGGESRPSSPVCGGGGNSGPSSPIVWGGGRNSGPSSPTSPGGGSGGDCPPGVPWCTPPGGPPTCGPVCTPMHSGQSAATTLAHFAAVAGCDPTPPPPAPPPPASPPAPTPPAPPPPASSCVVGIHVDESFLIQHEGALRTKGYVPKRGGKILGQSGVTISTGVDLGQQSASGVLHALNAYISAYGNKYDIDVDGLVKILSPYIGLKKENAQKALDIAPLEITKDESQLLASAFYYKEQLQAPKYFNERNTVGIKFDELPAAVQTVIVDYTYQYGFSETQGPIRQTFWKYVNSGQWQELATWLESKPDTYGPRRKAEGDLIQAAIDNGTLPKSGNPCPQQ